MRKWKRNAEISLGENFARIDVEKDNLKNTEWKYGWKTVTFGQKSE